MAKKGSELEKIVALLESKLNPNAEYKLNEMLPDLGNLPHKRECDIVIIENISHRPTITIVEVQDRETKTSIGDFTNFCEKKDAVGAHRLIVVSRQPFTQSIVDKAKKKGPTVQLININNINASTFEVGSVFINLHILKLKTNYGSDGYKFTENEKVCIMNDFKESNRNLEYQGSLFSIEELYKQYEHSLSFKSEGDYEFNRIIRAEHGLRVKLSEKLYPLYISFKGKIRVKRQFIEDLSEYRPHEEDPTIFYSKGRVVVDGKKYDVHLTYKWLEELEYYHLSAIKSKDDKFNIQYIGAVDRKYFKNEWERRK